MATANMNHLRVHNVSAFIDSVRDENKVNSHLFVGRDYEWENDSDPPSPDNSVGEYLTTQQDILGLQEIQQKDCLPMVRKINWTSGVVYDIYRHDYTKQNLSFSGASNVYDANFYVFAPNRHVYVCLDNNNNRQSTVSPQDLGSDPFYTSDGYLWLRLYQVSISDNEYLMDKFLPVTDTLVNQKEKGGVYSAVITNRGFGLDTLTTEYYCEIEGDGLGGVAKIDVEGGVITGVSVVRPGVGYSNASIDFNNKGGFRNLKDLDNNLNRVYPGGDNTARVTPILSPMLGWGGDIAVQLGATRVAINVRTLDSIIPSDITYRQVGVIQNPSFLSDDSYDKGTGRIVYLSNIRPVTRVFGQNEKVTFLIAF